MPEPRKYRLFIAKFSYGGNGGLMSEHPDVGEYLAQLRLKLSRDPRIADHVTAEMADTPITMCRNNAVLEARKYGADLLLMIDSDMQADSEPDGKPFWETSFDFLDRMYDTMPVVIGAPYGGPGDYEMVYVFRWQNCNNHGLEVDKQLKPYSRSEADLMSGIQPVGALPTGLILYDMRLFDLIDPRIRYKQLRDLGLTSTEAARACPHWFDYEWQDCYAAQKGSTEDVLNTRDLSLAGIHVYGRNPVFCNWDAWAGHWKPWLVRKPRGLTADAVSNSLADVVRRGVESGTKIERVNFRQSVLGDASDWQAVGPVRVISPAPSESTQNHGTAASAVADFEKTATAAQRACLQSDAQVRVLIGDNCSGRTTTALAALAKCVLEKPGRRTVVFAPTRQHLAFLYSTLTHTNHPWSSKALLTGYEVSDIEWEDLVRRDPRTVHLRNGSCIQFESSMARQLEGDGSHLFVIEDDRNLSDPSFVSRLSQRGPVIWVPQAVESNVSVLDLLPKGLIASEFRLSPISGGCRVSHVASAVTQASDHRPVLNPPQRSESDRTKTERIQTMQVY